MKPEIKAMLPELPHVFVAADIFPEAEVFLVSQVQAWLDKLTEGAEIIYDAPGLMNPVALRIRAREIKKQTPLEIAVEAMKLAIRQSDLRDSDDILVEALEKIEAAK